MHATHGPRRRFRRSAAPVARTPMVTAVAIQDAPQPCVCYTDSPPFAVLEAWEK